MAKEKFERTKPMSTLDTIGHASITARANSRLRLITKASCPKLRAAKPLSKLMPISIRLRKKENVVSPSTLPTLNMKPKPDTMHTLTARGTLTM